MEHNEHFHAKREKQCTVSGLAGGGVMMHMMKFFLCSTVLLIMALNPTLSDRFFTCELAGISNFHLIWDQFSDNGEQGSVFTTIV